MGAQDERVSMAYCQSNDQANLRHRNLQKGGYCREKKIKEFLAPFLIIHQYCRTVDRVGKKLACLLRG